MPVSPAAPAATGAAGRGEPPVTGASAQSMIAKLMTETPTHLRVLRNTVPPEIDARCTSAFTFS